MKIRSTPESDLQKALPYIERGDRTAKQIIAHCGGLSASRWRELRALLLASGKVGCVTGRPFRYTSLAKWKIGG